MARPIIPSFRRSRPCTAVVLYKEPDHHIQETVWKKHVLESMKASLTDQEQTKGGYKYTERECEDELIEETIDRPPMYVAFSGGRLH